MSRTTARIAVTGTPGSGKTTLCSTSNWESQSVMELAKIYECLEAIDANDGAAPVDVEKLSLILLENWNQLDYPLLIDGHLSHHLPIDAIVLLRCHPEVLQNRLQNRNYSEEKINQNIESELLGSIAGECFQNSDIPCLEIDSTEIDTTEIFLRLKEWVADGFKPSRPDVPVDWIAIIHGDG